MPGFRFPERRGLGRVCGSGSRRERAGSAPGQPPGRGQGRGHRRGRGQVPVPVPGRRRPPEPRTGTAAVFWLASFIFLVVRGAHR